MSRRLSADTAGSTFDFTRTSKPKNCRLINKTSDLFKEYSSTESDWNFPAVFTLDFNRNIMIMI